MHTQYHDTWIGHEFSIWFTLPAFVDSFHYTTRGETVAIYQT